MLKHIKSLLKNNNGQALVLVALALTALIGFTAITVDYGFMATQRRNLQNAADAAALAAAWELPDQGNVNIKAREFAKKNASELLDSKIIATRQNNNKEVKVDVEHTYNTFFGRLFGITEQKISATATAEKLNPWFTGLLPLADISEYNESKYNDAKYKVAGHPNPKTNITDFAEFMKNRIKINDTTIDLWWKGNTGNFGLMDLEVFSTGSKNIKDVFKNGVDHDIWGQGLPVEKGNVSAIESSDGDLSTRLNSTGGKAYIVAVLPSRVESLQGNQKTAEWGKYLILYLEDLHINYEKDNKGNDTDKIDKDKPLTGTLKAVYNVSAGEVPDQDFGFGGKSSRLIK